MPIDQYQRIIAQPACKSAIAYHNGILRGGWVLDGKFYYCSKAPVEVNISETKGLFVY